LEGRGFEIADGDELRVALDGGFGEDHTAFGGDCLAGVVFYCDALVDTVVSLSLEGRGVPKTDVEVFSGGDICKFGFAYECAVEEDGYFTGK